MDKIDEFNLKFQDIDKFRLEKKFNTYNLMYNKVYKEFSVFCLNQTKFYTHPKAEQIFEYAWIERHDEGLAAVLGLLDDLSDLFN